MAKRLIALTMALAMVLIGFSSCGKVTKAKVQVSILKYDEEVIYESEVETKPIAKTNGDNPVVADILLVLKDADLVTVDISEDYSVINSINDQMAGPDSSNKGTYYWTYSINGVEEIDEATALQGPDKDIIKDGDRVVFHLEWMATEESAD